MSTEPRGVVSGSDADFGVNASRFENGVSRKSETLADDELLVKLKRKRRVSVGDDEIETRNGVSDLKKETESGFGTETNGGETENDSDADSCESGDLNGSGGNQKQESKLENADGVVLAGGSASAIENLKLSGSDLVWAKVRSYPWWPGQVFDASVASKNAKKHFKKGKVLVAYFGDCTFAWIDVSMIKPFHQHFSQMEKQSNSPEFLDAIDCALEEVSRRVEFGLSCACISGEAYDRLKAQHIMNPGIREDSRVIYGGDKLSNAICFEPEELVEYMKYLACFPMHCETDKLQIVSKRAQLSAFLQWKSYLNFPKYEMFLSSELLASLPEPNMDEEMSSKKRKTGIKDNTETEQKFGFEDKTDEKTKEKALSDSIAIDKLDGKSHFDKKRKVESSESSESEKKIKNNRDKEDAACKNSGEEIHLSAGNKLQKAAELCFAIGDVPLRMESEMNSLTPALNTCVDSSSVSKVEVENKNTKPKLEELGQKKISSPDEKEIPIDSSNYEELDKFLKEITWSNLDGGSKKESMTETSESSDVNDPSEQQMLPLDEDITDSSFGRILCSADSSAPNALILKFADSVPSKEKLNSIFNRYGRLRESETQVMKKSKRAKVVFERSEDAKTAFSSAGKYSIFGPSLLSYSLKHVKVV